MLVGVLADTHGVFDPTLVTHFSGVHQILHAGDVGSHGGAAAVLSRLRQLAPTSAVSGNVDEDDPAVAAGQLPPTALLRLAGWLVLVVHILGSPEAAAAVERHQPDIVVHGHSHKYGLETVEGTGEGSMGCAGAAAGEAAGRAEGQQRQRRLHLNPGSAGPARFRLGRSVALLSLPEKGSGCWPSVERVDLAAKAPPRLPEAGGAGGKSGAPGRQLGKRTARQQQEGQQERHPQQRRERDALAKRTRSSTATHDGGNVGDTR